MKKIVALGAIAALAGGMIFADEPAIDMKIAEFNGNATVKWGMDLDAGQHGFENSTGDTNLKVNLWNEGTKATEGDGVWGEIEIKGKSLAIKNKEYDGDGNVSVEKALIHLGDKAYIGIKSGDTQVGEYKFDGAIRSADNDNAKWLTNVGPDKFSQGIVIGYGDDNFGVDVDLRSYYDDDEKKGTNTHYTSAYAIAAEAKLKDSNEFVSGLGVDAGVAYNISENFYKKGDDDSNGVMSDTYFDITAPAAILESNPGYVLAQAEIKALKKTVEAKEKELKAAKEAYDKAPSTTTKNAIVAAEIAVDVAKLDVTNAEKELADAMAADPAEKRADVTKVHTLGYSFQTAYKFAIDDTYYVKPAVGFTGSIVTAKGKDDTTTINSNNLVAGVLFGWGANADANAGVPFLDGDGAKKVTPGISVVAAIPLPTTVKFDEGSYTINDKLTALIVPSVYLGDLVENLKFAAYSEIGLLKWVDEDKRADGDKDKTINASAADKDRTMALAAAAGVSYDIKSDDLTITPKAGIRYANAAYFENKISGIAPLSSNALLEAGYGKMGVAGKDEKGNNDYFNLKAGVDVNGLIDNTTLFFEYASANLLNDNTYDAKGAYDETIKYYNIKNGTFNIGAKIHF